MATRKKMFRLMCLCAIPLFSLPLAASAENSLLIFHGDYGGGSSTHGVSHVLKYDKVNNVYYVTRQSYGIMNKVSGTAFETQDMKDSTKNLADAISSRKEKLAAETDQRTAADDAIQAKIDGSLVLTYDSDAHDTITLGGAGGTLLSNVKGDASDASSLANGGQLFDLNTAISGEVSAREDAVMQEASARRDADAALSDRLGTLSENETYHYVKASSAASMSDNLLSLDAGLSSNRRDLNDAISDREDRLSQERADRTAGDAALWKKLGTLSEDGFAIRKEASAEDNLTSLDSMLGELNAKADAFDAYRKDKVSTEKKEREEADAKIDDRIGHIGANEKVTYISPSHAVTDNLYTLDAKSHENRESLEKETTERKSALDALEKDANQRLDHEANYITDTGARVAALSSLRFGDYRKGQKSSFALSLGGYQGERAAAIGGKYYFNRDSAINVGTTLGNKKMSNLGVSFRIRMDTPELLALQSIKEEMLTLYDDNEKLQKEILKLKEKGDDPA